jgi:outer membrane biosynthesis protein TonB
VTERQSLGLAFALHAALFAALSFWVRTPSPLPSISETSIEVVDVADAPSVRAERPAETPAPPPPAPSETPEPAAEPIVEPAPPPPTPAPPPPVPTPAPPPPAPTPRPVDDRPAQDTVAEIAPKTVRQPATKAAPAPARTPPAKAATPSLDTDRLASLIGQARPRDTRPARTAPAPAAPSTARDATAFARSVARALPAAGRMDARTAANLEGAIRAQIAPCWNPPLGGADVATMTVVLRIRLARDGSVDAPPVLVSQTGATADNAAYARAFADTARRAVLRCAPIKLPPELFDYWREFELNFDPKLMT